MSKQFRRFLFYSIIAALLVVGLLYIFPDIYDRPDFTLGFLSCLVIVFLIKSFAFLVRKFSPSEDSTPRINVLLVGIMISLLGFYGIDTFQKGVASRELQLKKELALEQEKVDAEKNSQQSNYAIDIFNRARLEIENGDSILSEELVHDIVSLSKSYVPYQKYREDTLYMTSPERGRLLMRLLEYDIDSVTMRRICSDATFKFADLEGENLSHSKLTGIDLEKANLKDAKLNSVIMDSSEMSDAILWGASLTGADFRYANLKRVDLRWSDLKGAKMNHAKLDGSDLSNAKMREVDLSNSTMTCCALYSVDLSDAIVSDSDLMECNLEKAHAKKTDFSSSNLRNTKWTDATLSDSDFTKAVLRGATFKDADIADVEMEGVFVMGEDWFERLEKWKCIDRENITSSYVMTPDDSFSENYVLKKK